jgi:bifunctional non-homologous end joining protein LigD
MRRDEEAPNAKTQKPPAVRKACAGAPKPENAPIVLAGVAISHPDRVISETGRVTKGELAEYYAAVAPFMLPLIARRPLSLLRCPSGIGKQCFYQRNPGKGLGPAVYRFKFRREGASHEYLYIENAQGLLSLVQMGAIEIHPWGAAVDAIDYPDRLIFDLDPAPGVAFEAVKLAAQDLRQRLRHKGLESLLKCTGGKGLHVTVPLAPKDRWSEVKAFAASMASDMVRDAPSAYVATMTKAKRTGKIFIDYFRNDYTASAIADYAVRASPGAPVAVPLEWRELKGLASASQFTIKDVLQRLKKKKPGAALEGQRLPAEP